MAVESLGTQGGTDAIGHSIIINFISNRQHSNEIVINQNTTLSIAVRSYQRIMQPYRAGINLFLPE